MCQAQGKPRVGESGEKPWASGAKTHEDMGMPRAHSHTRTHTHTHTHLNKYRKNIYMKIYIIMHIINTHTHIHTYTYLHTWTHTYHTLPYPTLPYPTLPYHQDIHTYIHIHTYTYTVKSTSTGLALSQCNHSPVTLFYDFVSPSTCAATPECVRSDRTAT